MRPKLVLVVVDSLRTDMLLKTVQRGEAPNFARLLDRGLLIGDCVSSFPTVTPVCTAEITTGVGPGQHWISGMNWYHRVERRYVEYGSSLEATRTFGMFRALYDVVYNMNLGHLSHEVETVFEALGDAGMRTACTPFLIYRGRRRHELSLEGMMRRFAVAADFRHAVWGPDELFYGELYASRRVPCKPTLARPGTRDEYSGCVGAELTRQDLFDFLLFSLPDNDHFSHRNGPEGTVDAIAYADANLGRLAAPVGGIDAFVDSHAVILMADHAQTDVDAALPLAQALGAQWRVLQPNDIEPDRAELAVSPTARAANVYVLAEGNGFARTHAAVCSRLTGLEGVDLVAWLVDGDGEAVQRPGGGIPELSGAEAVVRGRAGELRFQPGRGSKDRRGVTWSVDGELGVLGLEESGGRIDSFDYPDALSRLWSALIAPHAGDIVVSAATGYECVDWGGATHVGGGSHGSLLRGDSIGPLLFCGCGPESVDEHEQWTLRDVAPIIRSHFGVAATAGVPS
jgi:type I phosphodiesterase/nucleotide pyrophosphatase